MNIRCLFGVHSYYIIRRFETAQQVGCKRCNSVWGMHPPTKTFIKWDSELNDLHYPIENEDIKNKYYELLFAVGNKYKDETRHQTALKYIKSAEEVNGLSASQQGEGVIYDTRNRKTR